MNTSDVFTGLAAKAADGHSTAKDDGWHIADCAPGGSYVDGGGGLHELSLDEIKANARLIAAAPEMYEAIAAIATAMNLGYIPNEILSEGSPILEGLRAAIAKAEGK